MKIVEVLKTLVAKEPDVRYDSVGAGHKKGIPEPRTLNVVASCKEEMDTVPAIPKDAV